MGLYLPVAGLIAVSRRSLEPLKAVLERQRERTLAAEKATSAIIPWLFHREGRPVTSFRRACLTARRGAGLSGRIPHDFRRTAVRSLERAGVPRSTAMKMVGHKTESIYRRYAIVDEAMLKKVPRSCKRYRPSQPCVACAKGSGGAR